MTLDSLMPPPPPPPPETSFRRQKTPCLSSKSAESHATKSAKDARRRRLELRRIRSCPPAASFADPPPQSSPKKEEAVEDRPLRVRRRSYGKISVVGRRREMDDAVAVELGFLKRGRESYDFYGVFEGQRVARACSEMLHQMLAEIVGEESEREIEWEEVMVEGFRKVVAKMNESGVAALMGSAAVVGENEVAVAGSKAVLSRGGVAVRLLEGDKGKGGDEACLRQVKVRVVRRSRADEILILGSDGFWSVICDELACQIARRYCGGVDDGGRGPEEAAALMAEMALAQGSKDNISVILVDLRGQDDGIGIPTSSLGNSV